MPAQTPASRCVWTRVARRPGVRSLPLPRGVSKCEVHYVTSITSGCTCTLVYLARSMDGLKSTFVPGHRGLLQLAWKESSCSSM